MIKKIKEIFAIFIYCKVHKHDIVVEKLDGDNYKLKHSDFIVYCRKVNKLPRILKKFI